MLSKKTAFRTYTIREASNLSGLPESTLRYYEAIGIIRPIDRNASSGHRVYTEKDMDILVAVSCLSATGMPLDSMKTYINNSQLGIPSASEQMHLLRAQQDRLITEARLLKVRRRYIKLRLEYWEAVENDNLSTAKSLAGVAKSLLMDLSRLKHNSLKEEYEANEKQ